MRALVAAGAGSLVATIGMMVAGQNRTSPLDRESLGSGRRLRVVDLYVSNQYLHLRSVAVCRERRHFRLRALSSCERVAEPRWADRTRGAPVPNMRVQRPRSSASPPHSPLTRGPLGGWKWLFALGLVLVPVGCSAERRLSASGASSGDSSGSASSTSWLLDRHADGMVELNVRVAKDGSVVDEHVVRSPGHDYSLIAIETREDVALPTRAMRMGTRLGST